MFHVQTFRPDPLLQEYVESYVFIGTGFHEEFICSTILPHVYQVLSFNLGPSGLIYDLRNGEYLPDHVVSGATDAVCQLRIHKNMRRVLAILRPGAWFQLFGMSARPILNRCISLATLPDNDLSDFGDHFKNTSGKADQVRLLDDLFLSRSRRIDRTRPGSLSAALRTICESGGRISVKELVRSAYMTSRTLERRFLNQTGVYPKMFARIVRFSETIKHLEGSSRRDWALLADRQGYYDQSHFINEFQFFAGCLPSHYRKDPAGMLATRQQ
jgi:AraC-like DNA-binding protein